MKQPVSCGFLVVQGHPIESFLLLRHPDRWDLPKGHVDPGETELECALRELEEETSIAASDLDIEANFLFENRYLVNQKRYGGTGLVEKSLRVFLGRLIRPAEIIVTEHVGYRWFDWAPPHQIQQQTIDPLLAAVNEHIRRNR